MLSALGDYIDGELEPGLQEAFEEHMSGCTPCEVVVDNIRKTITVYRDGEARELPPELHAKLCSVLKQRWKEKFPNSIC
jgi:anti-sigma factor RsiW